MYRLNSLNADIQLIVDGAWESEDAARGVIKFVSMTISSVYTEDLFLVL